MKAKVVIDGGEQQLIFTPESQLEKSTLDELLGGGYEKSIPCNFLVEMPVMKTQSSFWITLKQGSGYFLH